MRLNQRNYQKLIAKIVIGVIAFVALAILVAKGCERLQTPTVPENSGSTDISTAAPAIAVVERKPASVRSDSEIFTAVKSALDTRAMAREATNRTGVPSIRARKVVFNSDPLRFSMRGDRLVRFHLFDDTIFSVRFNDSLVFKSNRGEMTGVVEGDPESRVQIWVTKTGISGELSTVGRTFRFVYAGQGQHYIIEVATTH